MTTRVCESREAGSTPVTRPRRQSTRGDEMTGRVITEDQWRHIAVVALSDMQSLGMDLSHLLGSINTDQENQETVLKEVDRYMWDRENYS